jgi:hypothetical protein
MIDSMTLVHVRAFVGASSACDLVKDSYYGEHKIVSTMLPRN